MAQRTGAKAKAKKPAKAKLSADMKKMAKGKPTTGQELGIGHNHGIYSAKAEEGFCLWHDKIARQDLVLEKAKKLQQSERGRLGELYKEAEEAGIPKDRLRVLKLKLKMDKLTDKLEPIADQRELAWQMKATGDKSQFVQLGLFDALKEPTMEQWEAMGEEAGKRGDPIDNAPGKPGEDKHAHYVSGWKKGQRELANSAGMFGKKDGESGGDGADTPTLN